MNEGKYNIPKQYKVDKGMPLEVLFQRIEHVKCREIFETEVESIVWKYQLTDEDGIADVNWLIRQQGISVFEVVLRQKISTELLTETLAGIIQKPIVFVYLCEEELAMGTYIPSGKGNVGRTVSTDFFPYDSTRMIEILDLEQDARKTTEQIHKRLYMTLRQQKKAIMIEKAFQNMKNKQEPKLNPSASLAYELSIENLERIRADAAYCESRLHVKV